MNFDAMIDAIRAEDGNDAELAAATHLRLRRSLETRARSRHQLAGLVTAIAILLVGTVSWALATGKVTTLWGPAPRLHSVAPEAVPRSAPARKQVAAASRPPLPPESVTPPAAEPPPAEPPPAEPPAAEPPAVVPPAVEPAAVEPTPPAAPPSPARVAPVLPPAAPEPPASLAQVEELYRRAHELHFHGGEPAVTLAAWDAYLAAEPNGRFSVEARYNRALLLIRLERYAAARAALAPFARGEVEPAGYRQTEAEQLVERLARYE